jgi:hypothetical protein
MPPGTYMQSVCRTPEPGVNFSWYAAQKAAPQPVILAAVQVEATVTRTRT